MTEPTDVGQGIPFGSARESSTKFEAIDRLRSEGRLFTVEVSEIEEAA